MNKLTIIGNLVRAPELRSTQTGVSVCSFTVAVNKRTQGANGQRESDFFRVTVWRQLGEMCAKFLDKGKKVCVIGAVTVQTYQGNDGQTKASMEITADDVEFLSPRTEDTAQAPVEQQGFVEVNEDDLPF